MATEITCAISRMDMTMIMWHFANFGDQVWLTVNDIQLYSRQKVEQSRCTIRNTNFNSPIKVAQTDWIKINWILRREKNESNHKVLVDYFRSCWTQKNSQQSIEITGVQLREEVSKKQYTERRHLVAVQHNFLNFKSGHLSFTFKCRLSDPVVFLVSEVGGALPCLNHLMAPVWSAVHQPPQLVLVQVVPLFLDSNRELSQVAWSWLSHINSPLKHIPGMLCHIQIWRTCWPVFSEDVVGLCVGCYD